MSMRLSFCVKAATSLDADDLDTLTEGIEGYVKSGVDERQAETMALSDLQASVKRDREAIMGLIRAQHPDLFLTPAPAAAPAAAPEVVQNLDSEGNRIFAKGDRVTFNADGRAYSSGRSGTVSDVNTMRWKTLRFGAGAREEVSDLIYSYTVKTDGGAEFSARGDEIAPEAGTPATAVPDILIDKRWMPPEQVLASVEYARQSLRQAEGRLARAKVEKSKREHQLTIDVQRKKMDALQAAYDAWAKEHGKAEKPPFTPPENPPSAANANPPSAAPGLTLTKTRHTKTGADLWVVKMDGRVERAEYDRLAGLVRRNGGIWSKFTKGFNFATEGGARDFMKAASPEQTAPLQAGAGGQPDVGVKAVAPPEATFTPPVTPRVAATIVAPTLDRQDIDSAASGRVPAAIVDAAKDANLPPADLAAAVGHAARGDSPPVPLIDQVHAVLAADREVQAFLANPTNNEADVAGVLLDMAKSHTARLMGDDFEAANELFARWSTPKIAGPELVQEMRLRTGLLAPTIPVQENSRDSTPSAGQASLDNPLDAGPAADGVRPTEPVRGARPPRARAGRADGGSVRSQGGLFESLDDDGGDVGDRGGDGAVSDRPDDGLVGSGRRVSGRDFRPAVGGLKREGSWHATAKRNLDLIDLARTIEAEGRPATPEEQEQLSKYVGFGASEIRNAMFPVPQQYQKYLLKAGARIHPEIVQGQWKALAERAAALPDEWQRTILASTQYAHYTSEGIIRSVWSAVQRLGFTGGKIFEPGGGIGSFAMLMPDTVRKGSTFTGIEFDGPTALIARLLSPEQRMLHDDFIKRQLPDDFFDVSVGNPPFSQTPILADPRYAKSKFMMHDYFFAKSIDKVRPGGLLAFVTSKGTMDKQADKARKYLSARADFMGAVRLPSTAFEDNAGTSVVTDVIFLRKRMPGEAPGGLPWNDVKTVDTKDGPVVINEYFADNPDMVLGQNRISGNTDDQGRRINSNGMGGEKYTVVSYDSTPEELDAKFAQAIERLPQNVYSTMSADSATVKREVARMDFDPAIKREGVVYVGKNGDLLRVEQGVGKALSEVVKLSAKDEAWLKSYVGLRDLIQAARHAQVTDGDWQAELKKLNKAYDAFLKTHGPVNAFRSQKRKSTDEDGNAIEVESRIFTNRRLYREDYDAAIVTQLEVIDEDGNVKKGPFLLGRTIGKPLTRKVETIGDALAVSLDETGRLDLMDVARRLKITRAEAIDALGDQIYKTPQGQWQLADEFLSGNVVDKLEEAIEAARADATLERNIKALEAVQPEKLGPSQISVKLGASWVDAKHVNDFAKEIEAGAVTFDIKTETWQVAGGNMRSQRAAGAEFGTAARSPSELLEAVLNSRSIKIMTRVDKKDVVDAEATTAANEMAKKIKDKFKSWVWTDSERAADLVEAYNKRFNNLAPRRFDGSHLTLPGVSLRYKLHPHQLRAIWRQIQTGDTYLAHAVGAGKTIEMIAGGMEQKRLGLIRKPIYVVPNHMLEQFSNEFLELYPLANIMVADDQNFSKERRKAFVAAATLNAPDAIVITHDAFQRIGVKEESVNPIRDEILADLEDELADAAKDAGARVRRSQLEQQIEAVNQRFDRILAAGKKDGVIDFEDMGVDYIYVDEAHTYRKLDFHTAQTIKGIDPNGSLRAMDMYVKTRFLQKQRPGRAMTFASGTPVTNTMGELYTIMRFFDPKTLDEAGIATFDSWARMFGEVGAALEPNAAGKYEIVERFSKFDNVPELMSRIRRFMDVLQSEQLGAIVKRPETEGGKPKLIIVESTQAMRDYQEQVLQARLKISRAWKPSKDEPSNPDPVIAIISDGRIAAADPRFIPGGRVLPGETTKLDTAADEILAEYKTNSKNVYLERDGKTPMAVKGGTQIVFYNVGFGEGVSARRGFSPRAALNKRLVDGGIKREEIAWFDDADTDAKKEAIFKGMRAGTLKVLIGSAKKMGTGVNVQNRLTALHYMDPPWYPADVEQPTGRIIRQGNQNAVVRQRWYATKGGYDSTMWQMVGRKQRFIDQAFSGDKNLRSMEDLGEASLYEQAAALASGDPRALQLAGLKQDVERLERLQAAHANEQIATRNSLRNTEWNQESGAKQIATLESAQKAIGGRWLEFRTGKVGQREYTKQGEFGQALKDAFNAGAADAVLGPGTVVRQLGTIGDGIKISMHADFSSVKKGSGDDAKWVKEPNGRHEFVVTAGKWSETIGTVPAMGADVDAVGLARKVINALNGVDTSLANTRRRMDELAIDETRLRKKVGAPFEYQQEMLEKYGELKELEEVLRLEGLAKLEDGAPDAEPDQDGDTPAMFSRAPAAEAPDSWLYRFWNSRTWASEDDARDMMRRRIVEDNKRYAGMFKPNDPSIVDGLEFVRAPTPKAGFDKGKPQVKLKQPKAMPAPFERIGEPADSEGSDRPRVDWESRDMNDDGTRESVLQAYGRGHGNVYRAWVDPSMIPAPKGGGIVDGYPDMQGDYDWSELQRRRGSPPPLKLRVGKNGKLVLMDGNHRLAWWREQGVSEVPAYVIDERPQAMDVPFSRSATAGTAADITRVTSTAEAIASLWVNRPEIIVFGDMQDAAVPESVRRRDAQQRSQGATGDPRAFYAGGKVYLHAGMLKTPMDVSEALYHEALGHAGLRGHFGPGLDRVLDMMAALYKPEAMQAKAKEYGLDLNDKNERRQAAEEVLAELAQTKPDSTWVQRAIATIRDWLRKNLPSIYGDMALSDAEVIRNFILPARRFIERGREAASGGVPVFSRKEGRTITADGYGGDARQKDTPAQIRAAKEAIKRIEADGGIRSANDLAAILRVSGYSNWANSTIVGNVDATRALSAAIEKRFPGSDWRAPKLNGSGAISIYGSWAAGPDGQQGLTDLTALADEYGVPIIVRGSFARTVQGDNEVAKRLYAQGFKNYAAPTENAFKGAQISYIREGGGITRMTPMFSRTAPGQAQRRPIEQMVRNSLTDLMADAGDKVTWWNKSIGTQYAKAEKLPEFKRVFTRVQQYLEDTSSLANEAANEAKGILPKLETWQDLKQFGIKPADAEAIAAPIFNGTLDDKKVYSDDELRTRFKLTKEQVGLYRQFLQSVNTSLDQTLAADVLRLLPDVPPQLRELAITNRPALLAAVEAYLNERGAQGDEEAGGMLALIRDKFDQVAKLKDEGYAPLMRFGRYKVHIVDAEGGTLYFGLYETKTAANRAARELGEDPAFKSARFERGVLSEEQYKLFSGFPLDSLEMFAQAVEADKSEIYQEFLKIAKNNRSALKRLIHRKGTAGFSEDVPRVLAAFVTSNARLAAGGMNLNGAKKAAQGIRDGDVQDEAIKLIDAAENPGETAGMFRGLMFMNFIGGSIASAVVNLTQPLTMTLPYLSQWGGGAKAAGRLMAAGKMAASGNVGDPELRAALERAEADGIVSPQEIHYLTAQASGSWGTNPYLQRAAFVWAAPFSLAEQFNRRSSFIAAFRTAKEEGIANPFAFAEKAVIETQGLYNKGNAPNWARNPVGASVLTFKQFSIHYLEWMGRMWSTGEPGSPERKRGRMAVGLALAMLMLAAGTDGLPFADDLDDLIDTIGQALGYDMNAKAARRGFMVKTLGFSDEAADVVARGFSALPGIPMDVSLRMSMGNLLPGTAMLLRSNTDKSRDVLELAGPAGGLIKQYTDAATKGLAGDFGGAAMGATPVAIQNVGKAIGMWTTGEARDTAGLRVMDADEVDGLMRFLGFNPQAIARESEKMGMIRRSEQLAKNVEGAIAAQWARAFADGDAEGVAEARRELADWNTNNPEDRISITSAQILQRVKKLRQDRAQRFITSTSPERRAAVREAMQP